MHRKPKCKRMVLGHENQEVKLTNIVSPLKLACKKEAA